MFGNTGKFVMGHPRGKRCPPFNELGELGLGLFGQAGTQPEAPMVLADAIVCLLPRRLLVILVCCHAGRMGIKELASVTGFVNAAIPPGLLMTEEKGIAGGPLAQVRAGSCSARPRATSPPNIRGDRTMSIFSYHLIEALTGHVQAVAGAAEGLVSEVISHVWCRVPQSARTNLERGAAAGLPG